MTRFERWKRSPAFWRVLTLVLAALPQLIATEYPFAGAPQADHSEESALAVAVAVGASPLSHRLLEYVLDSGLVLLVAAIVLVLPREHRRRATPCAAGALALFGLILGYVAMTALESSDLSVGYLLLLSPFYLLAAASLVVGERRAASPRAADEESAGDQP
ncbi:hypothetical protein [Nonomuraea dietziae]|uniref:Uncharacterized protein n=1 Tax=Nonomuraea dietziae TaxID=65515 RepID=A0A7W5V290_9ACTN|nr:hypothetical protein [Nonomuraea dietziae]MBB3725098.1 hypothetical protein [Nonomuraea dietziae]